jgi:hypothetical protein
MEFPLLQNKLLNLIGTPKDPAPYLKVIDLGELSDYLGHVRDYEGNPWSGRIYGHELLEAPLTAAFRLLCEGGFAGELRTFDGCVCIRPPKGGSMPYSVHAWGLAVDFNAGSNGYGQRPTLSHGFVSCFSQCGFEWGGIWRPDSGRDGMHFQLAWTRVRTDGNPLNPVAWEGEAPTILPETAKRSEHPEKYRVTASELNIRSGPGTGYEVLGRFLSGAIVARAEIEVPAEASGWVPVLLGNGGTGWLSERYLQEI